jgi:hypothetical protein
MVRGVPILFFDTPGAAATVSDPESLAEIRAAVQPFATAAEAGTILGDTADVRDPPERIAARREIAMRRFHDVGGATDRALAAFYRLLDLPPP